MLFQKKREEKTIVTQKLKREIYLQTFLTEDLNNRILKKTISLFIFYHF